MNKILNSLKNGNKFFKRYQKSFDLNLKKKDNSVLNRISFI